MARIMKEDDQLFRVVVKKKYHVDVFTTYYGPYTSVSVARGVKTRELGNYWDSDRVVDAYVERITAGSFTDPIWEKVSG